MVRRIFKITSSFVVIFIFLATFLYLVNQILDGKQILWPVLGLWIFIAYIILPRVHRLLTKIYLPDYFIGRTRSTDGLYADPINLAFNGSAKNIHKAMQAAGWTLADDLNLKSSLKMIQAAIRKKSYPGAPVSSLYLFAEKQNFAYQQEVNGNPRVRHHIRFWRTPRNWWLPGGHQADWLAAGTFDRTIGFSGYTWQITHKITEDIDEERDYIIKTLKKSGAIKNIRIIQHFTTAFRHRNGGGDRIKTDGSLPFIDL